MADNTKQIIVITDRQDAHLSFVQKHLEQPLIVVDPQALLEKAELSFELDGARMIPSYQGTKLDNVVSVWYRKPRDVLPEQLAVDPDLVSYSFTCMQSHTVQLVTAFRDAFWVSDYYALRRASNKALQLDIAAQLGFATPRTLMTSSPERAKAFVRHEKTCIVKSQAAYSPEMKGETKSFLTRRISSNRLPELANLHLAPAIFQQYIDAAYDIRVTVVGKQVFPAKIKVTGDGKDLVDVCDWRKGHFAGQMKIEPYPDFPPELSELCLRLNQRLGLHFGAIDLIADKQQQIWFLENNPNGQWGFIERQAGLPIGKAMADLLLAGKL